MTVAGPLAKMPHALEQLLNEEATKAEPSPGSTEPTP